VRRDRRQDIEEGRLGKGRDIERLKPLHILNQSGVVKSSESVRRFSLGMHGLTNDIGHDRLN